MQAGASNYYSADSTVDPDDVGPVLSRMVIDSGLKIGQALDNDMEIDVDSVSRNGGTLTVVGSVENTGNDDYEDVIVCVVLFNDDGDVVLVVLSDEFDLDADATEDFTITAEVASDSNDVDTVSVLADAKNADEDDKLTEPVEEDDINVVVGTPTPTNTPAPATNTPTATPTP
jgi:hypothetical protein